MFVVPTNHVCASLFGRSVPVACPILAIRTNREYVVQSARGRLSRPVEQIAGIFSNRPIPFGFCRIWHCHAALARL